MRRKLSSRQTFLAKFIIPAVSFIIAAALFITPFFIMPLLWQEPFAWGPALVALGCVGLVAWWCFTVYIPLKVVSLDGRHLWVSNFRKEIAIPLSEVKQVAEVEQFRFKLVSLSLKRPTEFGREIKFMPRARLRLWKEHAVVGELRRLIEPQGD
jgi:hypothetical protein